jgi:hypothetical protein
MKERIILGLLVVLLFSCQKKKDWECTCKINNAGYPSYTDTMVIMNETKSKANQQCGNYGKSQIYNGTYSCQIH